MRGNEYVYEPYLSKYFIILSVKFQLENCSDFIGFYSDNGVAIKVFSKVIIVNFKNTRKEF